jgi:Proteasome non-ATPase 26S subunit
MLPLLQNLLQSIRDTDVLMIMNVIQFYTHLQESSTSPTILAFLEPKIPQVIHNLAPDADAFQSLLGAGTCEFLASLRTHPEFKRLDREYGIMTALETHVFNQASPQHVPALVAFSKIASTDGLFVAIDSKSLDAYKKLMTTRPITPEKLTALGILLSNNHNAQESHVREQWFTLPLADLVTPYIHDPTLQLSPLTLLSALAGHIWGVRLVAASSVIMEWLTDRQGEYAETTGKFAVVKRLLGTCVAVEGTHTNHRGALGRWKSHVEIFVSRGEWWREETVEVATQGG